jgi:hypothetical protein
MRRQDESERKALIEAEAYMRRRSGR